MPASLRQGLVVGRPQGLPDALPDALAPAPGVERRLLGLPPPGPHLEDRLGPGPFAVEDGPEVDHVLARPALAPAALLEQPLVGPRPRPAQGGLDQRPGQALRARHGLAGPCTRP